MDALYLDSPDANVQDFVARYQGHYNTAPSLLAAQAYDATQLVLEALRRGATSAREVKAQLQQAQDLPALGGPAGFNAEGILDRRLFVLQVQEGKIVSVGHENGEGPTLGEEMPFTDQQNPAQE